MTRFVFTVETFEAVKRDVEASFAKCKTWRLCRPLAEQPDGSVVWALRFD